MLIPLEHIRKLRRRHGWIQAENGGNGAARPTKKPGPQSPGVVTLIS